MARSKTAKLGHKLKALNVVVKDNGEFLLTGKDRGNRGFYQTLPIAPPCAVFWDEVTQMFTSVQFAGEVQESWELVEIIDRVD